MKDEKLDVYIYGLSYEHQEIEEPFMILPVHGQRKESIFCWLMGRCKAYSCKYGAVSGAGFDYIALGHLHEPHILIPDKAAYAGHWNLWTGKIWDPMAIWRENWRMEA